MRCLDLKGYVSNPNMVALNIRLIVVTLTERLTKRTKDEVIQK